MAQRLNNNNTRCAKAVVVGAEQWYAFYMNAEEQKRRDEIKRKIDEKIDQFNNATFPASDAPQWDSLQALALEKKHLEESTNHSEEKFCSKNQPL